MAEAAADGPDPGDAGAWRAILADARAATADRVAALQREFDEIVESGSLTNTDD